MSKIQYVVGDCTTPIGPTDEMRIITHCCNDVGAWGAGFVLALSRRWSEPERAYRALFEDDARKPKLGDVQLVLVEDNLLVVNLIGQRGVGSNATVPPVRYGAIRDGLAQLRGFMLDAGYDNVHMPQMGAGLAGGDWSRVESVVVEQLVDHGIKVYVYQLPHLAAGDPYFTNALMQ